MLTHARERLNELFGKKYPDRFRPEDVTYTYDKPEELAIINYTSGTTSFSKGVMLPYRSLWSNLTFAFGVFGKLPGEQVISMLPMAHMYGLAFEFIYEFASGAHVFFLTRTPSPKIIADAFSTVRPNLIISVPLIIEKIIRKKVFPALEKPLIKLMLNLPLLDKKVKNSIRQKVIDAFGGNFKELIVGGAALNKEVEEFLHSINFPYTVGYGMTECGPIICSSRWETLRRMGNFQKRFLRKSGTPYATENRFTRSGTYRRGNPSQRRQPYDRVLQERGSHTCRFHTRRLATHGRPRID